jgi:hypothetical protein
VKLKGMNVALNTMCGRGLRRVLLGAGLLGVTMMAGAVDVVTADVETILNSRTGHLSVWRLENNPNVMIFDFPSLAEQGRTFNRMTQLTEQFNEPYKRVLGNAEFVKYLEALRRNEADFAYGHDLLVSEFVLFFNLAERDKVELFPEELAVRNFLIEHGVMRYWRGIYQAEKGRGNLVVLSVPQVQEKRENEPRISLFARRAIVLHEIAHGEYYTNKYYAEYCRKFWWNVLTEDQRARFKAFLSNYNYSLNADELLINEMQAYLMFTPDRGSFSAAKLGVAEAELEAMRDAFVNGKPPTRMPIYTPEGVRR